MIMILWFGWVVLFGACLGSFLNVCIYRIPAGKSIIFPGSHCFQCLQPVRWCDNIPVLSYFWLRGRCRSCRASYSPRYMLVELLTACLVGLLFYVNVWTEPDVPLGAACARFVFQTALVAGLVAASFIDFDHYEIPDAITVPMMLTGWVAGCVVPSAHLVTLHSAVPDLDRVARVDWWLYAAGVLGSAALLVSWLCWLWKQRSHYRSGPAEWAMLLAWLAFQVFHTVVLATTVAGMARPTWLLNVAKWRGFWTGVVGSLIGAGSIWFIRIAGFAFLRCKRNRLARRARQWRQRNPNDSKRGRRRKRSILSETPPPTWGTILFGTKRMTRWHKCGPWVAKEAMGFGDVTLMAAIGSFLGWQGSLWALFAAPLPALAINVFHWLLRGQRMIPFGPYLSLGALMAVVFWPTLWSAIRERVAATIEVITWLRGR